MSGEARKADRAIRDARQCDARVRRGTGWEFCDAPLDELGQCPNAGRHVERPEEFEGR